MTNFTNNPIERHTTRYDIIIIMLFSATAFLVYAAFINQPPSQLPIYQLSINAIATYAALFLELRNLLGRSRFTTANDHGAASAVITVLAILGFPVIFRSFSIGHISSFPLYAASVLVFLSGTFIRWCASRTLGRLFDHALVIKDNHQIITHGLYRYIRHPAYLGTILLVLSSIGMWQTSLQLVTASIFLLLVIIRIKKEEEMMIERFGDQYRSYASLSWTIVPFLY